MYLKEKILNCVDAMIDNKREYIISSLEFDDSYVEDGFATSDVMALKRYIEFRNAIHTRKAYCESMMCEVIDSIIRDEEAKTR